MRPTRSSRNRALIAASALAMLLTACFDTRVNYGSEKSVKVKPAKQPGAAVTSAANPRVILTDAPAIGSAIAFTAQDKITGSPRSDIPIRITPVRGGPARIVVSGSDGSVRVPVHAGTYRVGIVAGCAARAMVTYGQTGTVGVPEGIAVRVVLHVTSTRRVAPGGPVTWTPEPPWTAHKQVRFTFHLFDQCTNNPMPNTSIAYYRYQPSALFKMHSEALRSNADSAVTISFECLAYGDGSIGLLDPQEPSDSHDLLKIRTPFEGTTWCA